MTSSSSSSSEIIQRIVLIRPILAFACHDIKRPLFFASTCSAFREAIVDYAGAEVAWRGLLLQKTDAVSFSTLATFMLNACKNGRPSWIICSLARAGAVYNEDQMLKQDKSQAIALRTETTDDEELQELNKNLAEQKAAFKLRFDFSNIAISQNPNDDDKNFFHYLAHQGRLDCVETLLELQSADPFHQSSHKKTPLHFAVFAKENSADIIEALLRSVDESYRKKYADLKDGSGQTALWNSVSKGNVAAAKVLITLGNADAETKTKIDDDRPVHVAASRGDVEMLKILIELGKADPNSRGVYKTTPLHAAVVNEKVDTAKYLLSLNSQRGDGEKVDVNAVDQNNSTALHRAVRSFSVEMVKLLLNFSPDLSISETKMKMNPLQALEAAFIVTDRQKIAKEEIAPLLSGAQSKK